MRVVNTLGLVGVVSVTAVGTSSSEKVFPKFVEDSFIFDFAWSENSVEDTLASSMNCHKLCMAKKQH